MISSNPTYILRVCTCGMETFSPGTVRTGNRSTTGPAASGTAASTELPSGNSTTTRFGMA